MPTTRSLTYEFKGKFDSLRGGLAAAGRSVDDFGKKLTGLDARGEKMRRGLTDVGNVAGKIGLGAAAGLTAIVGVTANFEKAMSSVAAATGEGEAGMKALRDAAIEAGAETAFSASEAAAGIEALGKAGVTTEEILAGGLQGALDLAAAGSLEVADAAEAAASAMTQFGLSGEDVPHIADLLAAAAGKAQGEVSDMAAALNQSGIIADQTGLTIEETTGALGAFAEAGLLGSDAGTSFKTMLGALTPNSEGAATAMEELGISAYDAQGNFIGLTGFADSLQKGMANLTEEQRAAKLEIIFGSDAVRAASILYENGAEGVQTWIDKVDDSGYAAEQAKTKLDNLSGDLEALRGSLETALIGAGSGSQGPLRKLVQGLTDAINKFNDLPPSAQGAVTKLLGITAVLGGGLWATSKIVGGIASTKQALSDLGIQAGRTKTAMAGLGKGLQLGALLILIPELEKALEGLFDTRLDESALSRDLETLAGGQTVGEVEKLAGWIGMLDDNMAEFNQTVFGKLPGTDSLTIAEEELGKIDEALAEMVESGNADQAAQIMAEITGIAEEQGTSLDQLDEAFGEYAQAVQNASGVSFAETLDVIAAKSPAVAGLIAQMAGETIDAAGATDDLAENTDDLGDSAERATPKIDSLQDAIKKTKDNLKDAREAAFDTAGEFFGLGDKVDKAKVSLSEWITDLEKQAGALRDFRLNAEEAARKGLDEGLIASLEEAGPTGALRMKQLADASEDEIERVNKAWRGGKREMGKFVDHVTGPLREALEKMQDQLKRLRDRLKELERQEDIRINVTLAHREIGAQFDAHNIDLDRLTSHAEGGTVPGPRHPYGDKVLAALAPGEEVISNRYGQADRYRADRDAGRIPGYQAGGTVMRTAGGGVSIDYDRLAATMLRARPLYGNVHITGDPTTFKRELAADARRASLGGFS